ncbi:MAG TPA: ABA4-like family protein [Chitinophagaceae bacterium]|nr:ABA4-like family protein [Chitinophagaceae bacterium]
MSPEIIFQLSSGLALIGWILLLIISPFWFKADKLLIGIVVTLLCLVYAWLIFGNFSMGDTAKFGSLDGVMDLFTNKSLVTAGWVHYLAFDLMTGTWIKRNGLKYGIPHLLLAPCLLLTFMLGPIGLLLYLLIRSIKTGQYFADNY